MQRIPANNRDARDADDLRDLRNRWKDDVDEERRAMRKQMADVASALEGIVTRLEALEEAPKEQRAALSLNSNLVYTAVSVLALILAALSHVTFH